MVYLWGAEVPIGVAFGILVLICLVVLPLLVSFVLHIFRVLNPDRKRSLPVTRLSGNWNIRRAILAVAESVALAQVVFFTFGCGFVGLKMAELAAASPAFAGSPKPNSVLFFTLGCVVGFLLSALWTALIFTLTEIERNTRHTAAMFDRLADRPR